MAKEADLYDRIRQLECQVSDCQEENARLKAENAGLRGRVAVLERKSRAAAGIKGESIIANLTDFRRTSRNASYDLEGHDLTGRKVRLEIKLSSMITPVQGQPTKRWAWNSIRGRSGKKQYDSLILVGDIDDDTYADCYDDKTSPFILFDIPFDEVDALLSSGGTGGHMIHLNINRNVRYKKTKLLRELMYGKYQTTEAELMSKYKGINDTGTLPPGI